jgi:hypothetical protein
LLVSASVSLTSGDGSLLPSASICARRRDRRTGIFSETVTLKPEITRFALFKYQRTICNYSFSFLFSLSAGEYWLNF